MLNLFVRNGQTAAGWLTADPEVVRKLGNAKGHTIEVDGKFAAATVLRNPATGEPQPVLRRDGTVCVNFVPAPGATLKYVCVTPKARPIVVDPAFPKL